MLILTRKPGEVIRIGHEIKIIIVSVNNKNQIKVGIQAPVNISVHREEVYARIKSNVNNDESDTHLSKNQLFVNCHRNKRFYLGNKYPEIYFTLLEAQCMKYFLEGCSDKSVSIILQLSTKTIKFYSLNMQAKLGCKLKKELIEKVKKSDFLNYLQEIP